MSLSTPHGSRQAEIWSGEIDATVFEEECGVQIQLWGHTTKKTKEASAAKKRKTAVPTAAVQREKLFGDSSLSAIACVNVYQIPIWMVSGPILSV